MENDLAVFDRFGFESQPVGVKYFFNQPRSIERLSKKTTLCEMIKEAQTADRPFYIAKEDQRCKSGAGIWPGNVEAAYEAGLFGQEMKIFKSARINVALNQKIPKLNPDIVNYIACAPLDKLPFDPDILIILTNDTSQTEVILRAMTYATGEAWTSRTTCVMGCSWLLAYPFNSGEVNFIPTGFGTGMIAKQLFPKGRQLLSIPHNWIPTITRSLNEMPWRIPAWDVEDVRAYVDEIEARLDEIE